MRNEDSEECLCDFKLHAQLNSQIVCTKLTKPTVDFTSSRIPNVNASDVYMEFTLPQVWQFLYPYMYSVKLRAVRTNRLIDQSVATWQTTEFGNDSVNRLKI